MRLFPYTDALHLFLQIQRLRREGKLDAARIKRFLDREVDCLLDVHKNSIILAQHVVNDLKV